jgi:hypothetical protein
MYEITVTREFEAWFKGLEQGAAEQVATALEVLESAGPALDPIKSSPYLLWYDGLGGGLPNLAWQIERWQRLRKTATAAHHLTLWQKEVVRALESPAFLGRLAKVDGAAAHLTFLGIERIRQRIHAARLRINLLAANQAEPPQPESFKRDLSEVLSLAGVAPADVADRTSGLREMTIEAASPALRLIYGIDVPRKCVLAILGEPLDRSFYGDSVRLAEKKWREYVSINEARQPWEP